MAAGRECYKVLWVILCMAAPTAAWAQAEVDAPGGNARRHIQVASDDAGVYLVLSHERESEPGFQIFFRGKTVERFYPGRWYRGQCDEVTAWQGRLLVFLSSGGCQSYDLSGSRTERALPQGLRCVASAATSTTVYVLARAEQSIDMPVVEQGERAGQGPSDANAPEAVIRLCSVDSGEYIVLWRDKPADWRCLTAAPLSLDGWRQFSLAVAQDSLHLFGIAGRPGEQSGGASLVHRELVDGELAKAQRLRVEDPVSVGALRAGDHLWVMVGVKPAETGSGVSVGMVFKMGTEADGQWQFTELALESAIADGFDNVAFAGFGDNVGVFGWGPDEKVWFGSYVADDGSSTCRLEPISSIGRQRSSALIHLLDGWVFLLVVSLLFLVVYWRRRDAFLGQAPLINMIKPAPLWRRMLAFLIDAMPAFLIALAFSPELQQEFAQGGSVWRQAQEEHVIYASLRLTFIWLPVLIVYYAITESLRGASPGKMALRIIVISYDGGGITVGQALGRNIGRFLEFFPQIPPLVFILMLFTRCRQRPGDLLARTMVVLDTPDLREHLSKVHRQRHGAEGIEPDVEGQSRDT